VGISPGLANKGENVRGASGSPNPPARQQKQMLSLLDQHIVDVATNRILANVSSSDSTSLQSFSKTRITVGEKINFALTNAAYAIRHLFNLIFYPVLANVEKVITKSLFYTTGFNALSPKNQNSIKQFTFVEVKGIEEFSGEKLRKNMLVSIVKALNKKIKVEEKEIFLSSHILEAFAEFKASPKIHGINLEDKTLGDRINSDLINRRDIKIGNDDLPRKELENKEERFEKVKGMYDSITALLKKSSDSRLGLKLVDEAVRAAISCLTQVTDSKFGPVLVAECLGDVPEGESMNTIEAGKSTVTASNGILYVTNTSKLQRGIHWETQKKLPMDPINISFTIAIDPLKSEDSGERFTISEFKAD